MTEKNPKINKFFLYSALPIVSLFFLVFIAYTNSLFGDFLSDDIAAIVEDPKLGEFGHTFRIPLRTARNFVVFVAYTIGGVNNTFPYHLINTLFHFGCVTLIFLILRKMTKNWILGFIAAALFAVHPILAESVSWISGGVYAQAAFFMLLSFYFYISRANWRNYALSIIAFVFAAITSPERAFLFPLILGLYEVVYGDFKKNWWRIIAFLVIAGTTTLQYAGLVGQRLDELGVKGTSEDPDLYNPLISVPASVISYLILFFWPDKLTLYQTELVFNNFLIVLRGILFFIYLALLAVAYKKDKFVFFWMSFFLIALLPTLTPFKIAWLVAERYVYMGTLGLIAVIVYLILKFTQKKELRIAAYCFFVIVGILLCARTIVRNIDWKNQDNLWIAADRTSPSSHNNHNNLGDMYTRHGRYELAVKEFARAIEIKPDYADAYHNLANVYKVTGQYELAFKNYSEALKINPNIWQSYHSIAEIYFAQENYLEALTYMGKALEVSPHNPQILSNIGIIYAQAGDKNKAREYLLRALELYPNYAPAQAGLESLNK